MDWIMRKDTEIFHTLLVLNKLSEHIVVYIRRKWKILSNKTLRQEASIVTNTNSDYNRKKTNYPNIGNTSKNVNSDPYKDVGLSESNVNFDINPRETKSYKSDNFDEIKKRFQKADIDEKIEIYTTTSGLSVEQFKELLRLFPLQYLDKLERAMEE